LGETTDHAAAQLPGDKRPEVESDFCNDSFYPIERRARCHTESSH